MEKPLISGFNIFINGGQRTFRDQQPAAYEVVVFALLTVAACCL